MKTVDTEGLQREWLAGFTKLIAEDDNKFNCHLTPRYSICNRASTKVSICHFIVNREPHSTQANDISIGSSSLILFKSDIHIHIYPYLWYYFTVFLWVINNAIADQYAELMTVQVDLFQNIYRWGIMFDSSVSPV